MHQEVPMILEVSNIAVVGDADRRGVGEEEPSGTEILQADDAERDDRDSCERRAPDGAAGTEADRLLDLNIGRLR